MAKKNDLEVSKTNCFRARVQHIEKQMKRVNGTTLVAVDVGYSTVKYFSSFCRGAFPSYAYRVKQDNPKDGILAVGGQTVYQLYDCITDSLWVLGDDAFDYVNKLDVSMLADTLYSRNRYDEDYRILTATGIALATMDKCKLTNKASVYLHTGLPHRYLKEDSWKVLDRLLGEYSFRFSKNGKDWVDFNFVLDEKNIKISSQPSGTFRSILMDDDIKPMQYAPKLYSGSVLIIDPGFLTLDYFTYSKGKMIGEGSTDENYGMKAVFDNAISRIKKYCIENCLSLVYELSAVEFQKRTLQNGFFFARDKKGNLTKIELYPFIDEAVKEIGTDAIMKIDQTLPENFLNYDFVILTGGTSNVWYDIFEEYLKDNAPETKLLKGNNADYYESSIYANVRGYYISSLVELNMK